MENASGTAKNAFASLVDARPWSATYSSSPRNTTQSWRHEGIVPESLLLHKGGTCDKQTSRTHNAPASSSRSASSRDARADRLSITSASRRGTSTSSTTGGGGAAAAVPGVATATASSPPAPSVATPSVPPLAAGSSRSPHDSATRLSSSAVSSTWRREASARTRATPSGASMEAKDDKGESGRAKKPRPRPQGPPKGTPTTR